MALITGNNYSDIINGTNDDDTIDGRGGSDFIDGGSGTDTAVFFANSSDFTVTNLGGVVRVTGLRSAPTWPSYYLGEVVKLLDVEKVQFTDKTIDLTPPAGNLILKNNYAETINGTDGNDIIDGNGGSDFIDGGSGTDTAVFFANSSDFTVTNLGGVVRVTGLGSAPTWPSYYRGETVELLNVEKLQFIDKTISLDGSDPEHDTSSNQDQLELSWKSIENQINFQKAYFIDEAFTTPEQVQILSELKKVYLISEEARIILHEYFSDGRELEIVPRRGDLGSGQPLIDSNQININLNDVNSLFLSLSGKIINLSLGSIIYHEFLHVYDRTFGNSVPIREKLDITEVPYSDPEFDHLGSVVRRANEVQFDLGEELRGSYTGLSSFDKTLQSYIESISNEIIGSYDQTILFFVDDDTSRQIFSSESFINGSEPRDLVISLNKLNEIFTGGGNDTIIGNLDVDLINSGADNDRVMGREGNDIIDGGEGIDTVIYRDTLSNYLIRLEERGFLVDQLIVTDHRITSENDGTDTLKNVERLIFTDFGVAFDLDGPAGNVAKLIGVVFGAGSISNTNFVGMGLNYLDGGGSYEDLAALAIDAVGVKSPEQVTYLLWTNVVGSAPTGDQILPYIDMMTKGTTAATLGVLAAETTLNQENIDLVGLMNKGITYNPIDFLASGI